MANVSLGSALIWNQVQNTIRNTTSMKNSTLMGKNNSVVSNMDWPLYMSIYIPLCYVVIFLVGVCGNVLVLMVIWRHRGLRNSTNLFLLNLSFADLLVLIVTMPSAIGEFYAKERWFYGEFLCKLSPFIENAVSNTSVLTILSIGFERYYAVCFPLKAHYKCTTSRTIKVIAIVWFFGSALAAPFLSITKLVATRFHDGSNTQVCSKAIQETWHHVYIDGIIALFYFIPLVILTILYGRINYQLRLDIGEINATDAASRAVMLARRKIVTMLVGVVALFFSCLLPIRVLTIWSIYSPIEDQLNLGFDGYYNLAYLAKICFYINSSVNPILYSILSANFRDSFRKALHLCPGQEHTANNRRNPFSSQYSGQGLRRDYTIPARSRPLSWAARRPTSRQTSLTSGRATCTCSSVGYAVITPTSCSGNAATLLDEDFECSILTSECNKMDDAMT